MSIAEPRQFRLSGKRLALLEELRRKEGLRAPAGARIPRRERGAPIPLSFAQERIWFLERLSPGTPLFNMPFAFRFDGDLDPGALGAALTEISRRHDSLRTTLRETGCGPVQIVAPPALFPLPLLDLSGLPEARREPAARNLARAEARCPFDLERGPLARALLLRLSPANHLLLITFHHLIGDGASMAVYFRELVALYRAFRAGEPSPLPEPELQYGDFAAWQREQLCGPARAEEIEFWRRQLAGAPLRLDLPFDHPRPPVLGIRGGERALALPPATVEAVRTLAQAEGATTFMVLLAAFGALLARWTDRDTVLVGSPVAGRTRSELEEIVGLFVNVLVLRVDAGAATTFRDLVVRVRDTAVEAYAHQDLPFELLVEELQPQRDPSVHPIVQAAFNLEAGGPIDEELPGVRMVRERLPGETTKLDLMLVLRETGAAIKGILSYARDLIDPTTAARWCEQLTTLASGAAAAPDGPLGDLPLLSPAERHQVQVEWSFGQPGAAREPIHELIAMQARRAPTTPALVGASERVTYEELDRRANRLAHHLRALGVERGDRVAVCLERSPSEIGALLAVLKAGAAYLPLDPAYPRERLVDMVSDSGARFVLTDTRLAALVAETGVRTVCLDRDGESLERWPDDAPPVAVDPADLAYVIYTSGSTGRPNGAAIEHRGLSNLVASYLEAFDVRPGDHTTRVAGLGFDATVFELWPCLAGGATVHIPDEETRLHPEALRDWILRQGVTVAFAATSTAEALLSLAWPAEAALRLLLTGGEKLHHPPSPALPFRFFNNYGPTENTVWVTSAGVQPGPASGRAPSIGRPIGGVRVLLLDRERRPVPAGVAGELCVGGSGLARGYLGRPELTAERFVPDPLAVEPGARLYRTGDLASFRPDGTIEFLGRADRQTKIQGFRVELGEVEAVLNEHPAVRESAIVVREYAAGDSALVAFVACHPGASATREELRSHLKRRLPRPMLPAGVYFLPTLPLTPNGKVDRTLLARLGDDAEAGDAATGGAPRTAIEEILAGIWAEVLDVRYVGVDDDFFALGGHSLKAARVVSRVREMLGYDLPVRSLFEEPTVAALAAQVARARGMRSEDALPPIARLPRNRPLPLSFAQQRLWFLTELGSTPSLFNLPLAFRIRGRLDTGALARSLADLTHRHEVLRMAFTTSGGMPVQVPLDGDLHLLPHIDLTALPDARREACAADLLQREAWRPFDLERGPQLRSLLVRLAEEEHAWLLVTHHIAFDGWSMAILSRELTALFAAHRHGGEPPLVEIPVQYADYAGWQRGRLQGEVLARLLAYWRGRLAGMTAPLELPTDRPRPPLQTFVGGSLPFALPHTVAESVARLSRREGCTVFMVLLAAYRVLLGRSARQERFAIGSPVANRVHPDVEGLIGCFLNNLVLATDLTGDPTFTELLARERETALGAYEHQELPFERLVEELELVRDLSRAPLFQAMFVLQNMPGGELELPGLELARLPISTPVAQLDINLLVTGTEGALTGVWSFNTDLFDRTTIARLSSHLEVLLTAATEPGARIRHLPLLTTAERHQLLVEWSHGHGRAGDVAPVLLDDVREPVPIGVTGDVHVAGTPTGEVARYLPWGELELLSRGAGDIAAIEAALAEHPGVRQAAVVVKQDASGRPFLVAYFLPASAAPQNELERRIATVWSEVLGLAEVDVRENFFELGGTSLLAVQLRGRLSEELGRSVPLVSLFRFPTVESLARYLEQGEETPEAPADAVRQRAERQRQAKQRRKRAQQ